MSNFSPMGALGLLDFDRSPPLQICAEMVEAAELRQLVDNSCVILVDGRLAVPTPTDGGSDPGGIRA